MSIFIFSRQERSGKTTELINWSSRQSNISGIVMPDIDGSRKILDLGTKTIFDIECTDTAHNKEPLTAVGRFHFYTSAFEKANAILQDGIILNPNWLVIDEAGKLELEGRGFYNSIIKAVEWNRHNKHLGNLLITVRESLCARVISFFKMEDCRIMNSLDELF